MKVACLVPSTSKHRTWTTPACSSLNALVRSIRATTSLDVTIFAGVDHDDPYYLQHGSELESIARIIPVRVDPGYVTHIWNSLAKQAYDEGYDYLIQCGDDIVFETPEWLEECVAALSQSGNVGVAGPTDRNNPRLLTQTVVHRMHMDIFGFYFPPEIPNWFCDDWINEVYDNVHRLPPEYTCVNAGGSERYTIVECRDLCTRLVRRDKKRLNICLSLHQ
jgi:hypothetical protein